MTFQSVLLGSIVIAGCAAAAVVIMPAAAQANAASGFYAAGSNVERGRQVLLQAVTDRDDEGRGGGRHRHGRHHHGRSAGEDRDDD